MREEIKAGLIIVGAMLILSLSVVVIGGSRLFDSFDTYYVKLFNVTGLDSGSQVKLGGMNVGRVLSIKPPQVENQPILIELGIAKDTALHEGVTAVVSQVGFVGDIFLQLDLGASKGRRLKPGETIPSVEQSNFNTIMAKAEALTVSLKKLVEDTDKLFTDENISKVSRLLDSTNTLIENADHRLASAITSLKGLSERLSSVISKAEGIMDENREGIKDIVSKARLELDALGKLIASLEASSKKLNGTLTSADTLLQNQNENLDELFRKITITTESLNEAITEFNQKPWRIIYKERAQKEE